MFKLIIAALIIAGLWQLIVVYRRRSKANESVGIDGLKDEMETLRVQREYNDLKSDVLTSTEDVVVRENDNKVHEERVEALRADQATPVAVEVEDADSQTPTQK